MGNLASIEREQGRRPTDPSSFSLDVLKFLPWQDRAKASLLHKRWRFLYNPKKNPEHARWCARRLVAECGLYCPPKAPPGLNFVAIFEELWSRKSLFEASAEDAMVVGADGRLLSVLDPRWSAAAAAATASRSLAQGSKEKDRYSITVSARFRPVSSSSSEKETTEEQEDRFVLPLHQRLQPRLLLLHAAQLQPLRLPAAARRRRALPRALRRRPSPGRAPAAPGGVPQRAAPDRG